MATQGMISIRYAGDSPLCILWRETGVVRESETEGRLNSVKFEFVLGSPEEYGRTVDEQLRTVAQHILAQVKPR